MPDMRLLENIAFVEKCKQEKEQNMFCKYCGKKIEKSEKPCPYCGKPQELLCSTDGYFGILGSVMTDGSGKRKVNEVHIEDRMEGKKEEMERENEAEKLLEGSEIHSRETDSYIKQKIGKRLVNERYLRILAIVILLILFMGYNFYQNYNMKKRISDLEQQMAISQEATRNGDEEKVSNEDK